MEVIHKAGAFFNLEKMTSKIILFGAGSAGKAFSSYLRGEGYSVYCFCDKKAGNSIEGIPVYGISDVEAGDYAILLLTRSEKYEVQMAQEIEKAGIGGKVYGWEAFCVDYRKEDNGKYKGITKFVMSKPWFYGKAFENENLKEYFIDYEDWIYDKYIFDPRGYYCNEDIERPTIAITNGMRKTENVPDTAENSIFVFGDSRAFGLYLHDKDTIPSVLQRQVRDKGFNYEVKNMSTINCTLDNIWARMQSEEMKAQDVVIVSDTFLRIENKDRKIFPQENKEDYLSLYLYYYNKIKLYCDKTGVKLYVVYLPKAEDISNKPLPIKTIDKFLTQEQDNNFTETQIIYRIAYDYTALLTILRVSYDVQTIDLTTEIKADEKGDFAFADCLHFSKAGAKIMAEGLYRNIFLEQHPALQEDFYSACEALLYRYRVERALPLGERQGYTEYSEYIDANKVITEGKIGSIVMNANPFTKGHLHLAEYAASESEWLYIFVVEEDKSRFSFVDRFAMVKAGTSHLKNVSVLRSGRLIVSSSTFPEYFTVETEADCTKDLTLFSMVIAPKLGICRRFVGEEPYSPVTASYHRQMKRLLPQYGIEVTEIPRVECGEGIVSATKVRKLIEEKAFDAIRAYAPNTTVDYIRKMEKINED